MNEWILISHIYVRISSIRSVYILKGFHGSEQEEDIIRIVVSDDTHYDIPNVDRDVLFDALSINLDTVKAEFVLNTQIL